MGLETGNGDKLNEVILDYISSELINDRKRSIDKTLRDVKRKFPQIKPMVKDARRFARLTKESIERDDLPKPAEKIKDKYFNKSRSEADLFTELVEVTQELAKYQT